MTYLVKEIDSAYCTNLSSIIEETYVAVWCRIKFHDVHLSKAIDEIAPYISSESISYGEPNTVFSVTLFLWVQLELEAELNSPDKVFNNIFRFCTNSPTGQNARKYFVFKTTISVTTDGHIP